MTTKAKSSIYAKLLAAQKAMPPIKQSGYNPMFKSKYAKLDDILEAVVPVLNANGLAMVQEFCNDQDGERGNGIETVIYDEDGNVLRSGVMPVADVSKTKNPAQAMGSAVSYAKRYSISAMLGIRSGDEDDGSSIERKEVKEKPKPRGADEQRKACLGKLRDLGVTVSEETEKKIAELEGPELKAYFTELVDAHKALAEGGEK